MAFGGGKDFTGMLPERMAIAKQLWDAGVKAEYLWKTKPKLQNQFKAAENGKVPWAIILGDDELKAGKIKIKEMGLPDGHPEKDGVVVEKARLVDEIQTRLSGKASLPDRTAA
jgi:histidyl-tRNA synthetase